MQPAMRVHRFRSGSWSLLAILKQAGPGGITDGSRWRTELAVNGRRCQTVAVFAAQSIALMWRFWFLNQ
ncbi:hypothetical protein Poly41_24330 [Novipirellula artificiosorum]|uniref:Uncharacterized protein n=1 Tax=Novipirellula artificiosorum TaxID=2528016 RepID=A0A5C6DS28_9BACT|nr:hypothetical protein Poly41_24330 [Novipirellula artificiosorum]